MSLKTILNKQTDFTGEFPAPLAGDGLWRFNEDAPDADTCLADSSGNGRKAYINNWSGTTASLTDGIFGTYFRMNINNPSSEKTYLRVTNDGSIFSDIGERIIVGGWMKPTTYSVGNTYTPLLSTRAGTGNPIFYLSLIRGKPRIMLYNSSGSLILDTSVTPSFSLTNGNWYFIAAVIEPDNKKAWHVVGDKESGTVWKSSALTITGDLNRSCTADLVWGMLNNSYWYAGGFDDWFLDCDSALTADDLMDYFRSAVMANAGDTTGDVDGLTEENAVVLRASSNVYPTEGVLTTAAAECSLSGTGRVSVTSEYISGTTAIPLVETSTSDDLITWSDWVAVPADGKLASPNRAYIRFRVTLTTTDTSKTPKLIDIRLYDIPKSPYEKIGYSRPVVLDGNGAWEAVLENAYDIIVTGEINGEDTLSFKIPYRDGKRSYIDSEKKIQIYNTVKAYDSSKLMNICLPGMTSVNGSVGGENWCVYADLNNYCDTASIMSYGMAWAGSAPGPVSPRSWLEGIYDYASQVMDTEKVFLGMPAYGWNWQIYDKPANIGKTYRGTSQTYYAAQNWLKGVYNFTDDQPPQPFIPFVGYWDDNNKVPWALPHVYDYMEGRDADSYEYPQMSGTYNGRHYLTAYSKQQKTEFENIIVDHDGGNYASASGIVSIENGIATLGDEGSVTYRFTISTAGTYDVAVRLCYPFWDKNGIYVSLDGATTHFTESRLWWPYWRSTFWISLASGVNLSAGTHTLSISVDVKGVQFYGFRVCSSFSEAPSAGEAVYSFSPRRFKDVNGDWVGPDRGFRLTLEMLRRKPDSALVWYEDFRDYGVLETNYWTVLSGSFEVWRSEEYSTERVYSQLDGSGQLAWKYNGFSDIHLRARLAFPANSSGKAGVFCGNLFCCLNYDSQAVELYNGSTLIGTYSQEITRTATADLRDDPAMYTVEMRIRGNKVRVYSGSSYTLRFTATVSGFSGGYAGYRSDNRTVCELMRLGDAWTYEPYERFDVVMPDGTQKSYGRISRSNCTWDSEFQVFTLTADVEESSTRSEDISMDYDFFHSDDMTSLSCGNDYEATVIPVDINIWISRLFLGDADGFSILYYQDVDSLVYWANEAAYRWKLRGMCMWSLGQEDLRLWEWLPKQV